MDNITSWNNQGLNSPNKQEDVKMFPNKTKIGLVGLLGSKVKHKNEEEVASKLFGNWNWHTNARYGPKGRIWVA